MYLVVDLTRKKYMLTGELDTETRAMLEDGSYMAFQLPEGTEVSKVAVHYSSYDVWR